ncbi:MAG: biotin--[acetyl-CoA-carboxylase] ligase, partial [Gemmatimonadota bacterium]
MAEAPEAVDTTPTPHPDDEAQALARVLDVPLLAWYPELASTMDVAHALAQRGAPSGTVVLADAQTRGRGRGGKRWSSGLGAGLWMTLIDRPTDASGIDVLSLRVGLRAARALDRYTSTPIALKWPNDLMLPGGKLGGILVEVRWREQRPEWVAVGIGVNLVDPGMPGAAALGADAGPLAERGAYDDAVRPPDGSRDPVHASGAPHASSATRTEAADRTSVLGELLPALRAACRTHGALSAAEIREFAARDWACGRRVCAPQQGTVAGISPAGELL